MALESPYPGAAQGPRVGLVLGAGGVLGAAWLIGALHALSQESGWDPTQADYIVGTSAGSVVGALTASGLPPWFLLHHQRGGSVEGMVDNLGEPIESPEEQTRRLYVRAPGLPRLMLGSPQLALRAAMRPWRFPPAAAAVGWMWRGFLSNDQVGRIVRRVVPEGWGSHENLWIVAVDYATGRRVVFGQDGAPKTDLWRAVSASCAIPGFYRPVRIDGRDYVDGGAWSPSNADLLARTDVDMVVALNPMSSLNPGVPTNILEHLERRIRSLSGRRLGREARRVREAGKPILLVQPEADDLAAMGINLMNPRRRRLVLETALNTTRRRLAEPDAKEFLRELSG
jgi:NTE family protein